MVECSSDGCETSISARANKGMCAKCLRDQRAIRLGPCSAVECSKPQASKGLCSKHAYRVRKYGSLDLPREVSPKPTCSVDSCDRPAHARGFCGKHYYRFQTYGSTETSALKNPLGINSGNCSHQGCDKKPTALGYCAAHYWRMKKYGTTKDDALVRSKNFGMCSVQGCENPMRKRTWCASHYSQWRLLGEVREDIRGWADRGNCIVCASPCVSVGLRKYCSPKCQALASRTGGVILRSKPCERCGKNIELVKEHSPARKKRSDATMCADCKHARVTTRHHMSIARLVARDGSSCSICGEFVDVNLKKPDMFSPSVDHIFPFSLGGTHDPENLALAHLWCNQVKNNRVGWKFTNP